MEACSLIAELADIVVDHTNCFLCHFLATVEEHTTAAVDNVAAAVAVVAGVESYWDC